MTTRSMFASRGVCLLLAATALLVPAPARAASTGILLGASGERELLSRQIGVPLASHAYAELDGPVEDADLINIQGRLRW